MVANFFVSYKHEVCAVCVY